MEPSLGDLLDLWRLYLVWFVQLMAVPVALGVVFAVVGVLIFGPRTLDSLILPAMAVFGVTLVALRTSVLTTDAPVPLLTVAAAVGVAAAGIQRELGDRVDTGSRRWPQIVGLGGIVIGALAGGVLAYAISVHEDWAFRVFVGAVVGGVIGSVVRDARQSGDLDPE